MRYRFIDEYRARFRVRSMCRVLGVGRSGFYDWCRRPESARAAANRRLVAQGEPCGRHRVARLRRVGGKSRLVDPCVRPSVWPATAGDLSLSPEYRIRRGVITRLMCDFALDIGLRGRAGLRILIRTRLPGNGGRADKSRHRVAPAATRAGRGSAFPRRRHRCRTPTSTVPPRGSVPAAERRCTGR